MPDKDIKKFKKISRSEYIVYLKSVLDKMSVDHMLTLPNIFETLVLNLHDEVFLEWLDVNYDMEKADKIVKEILNHNTLLTEDDKIDNMLKNRKLNPAHPSYLKLIKG